MSPLVNEAGTQIPDRVGDQGRDRYTIAAMKPPHSNGPRGRSSGRPIRHGAGSAPGGGDRPSKGGERPPGGGDRPNRQSGDAAPRTDRPQTPYRPQLQLRPNDKPPNDRPPNDRPGDAERSGPRHPTGHGAASRQQDRPKASSPGAYASRPTAKSPRQGPPDAPRGTVWLYGMHAVAAALANPNRRLRRLLLTTEAEATLAGRLPQPWPVAAERIERPRLDQLLGREIAHQGVALLADPLAPPSLAQALERPGPVLVLDQVSDPRNVGAILRAAAAFGAAAVITQERNAPEETGALAKAASGALEKLPMFRAVNIARTLVALKAAGCWVIGLDAGGSTLSGPALRQRRVALVMGSEGEGLRRLTRDTCDEIVGLAVPSGHSSEMESLNVSAAAAIALYELTRP